MDRRFKTKDYEMLPDVATYLDERMKTIEKHLGEEADKVRMEVEIGKSAGHSKRGDNWFAEVQIIRPGEARARVTAKGQTVNEAIDAAKEEILRSCVRVRRCARRKCARQVPRLNRGCARRSKCHLMIGGCRRRR